MLDDVTRLWIIKKCIGDFSRSQNSKFTRIIKLKLTYLVSVCIYLPLQQFQLALTQNFLSSYMMGENILSESEQSELKLLQRQGNTHRNKVCKFKLYYSHKFRVLRLTKISSTFLKATWHHQGCLCHIRYVYGWNSLGQRGNLLHPFPFLVP